MKILHLITPLVALIPLCLAQQENNPDSIIMKDGGLMYGYLGEFNTEDNSVSWLRKDADNPHFFKIKDVSQICINGSRPQDNAPHHSHIELINGDRIPGEIQSIGEEKIILKTEYSGLLTIDKTKVLSLYPAPDGEPVVINGFGAKHNWQKKDSEHIKFTRSKKKYEPWQLHGASFYASNNDSGYIINPDLKLPEDFVCKFKYSYTDFPKLHLVLQADLKELPVKKDAEDQENVAIPNHVIPDTGLSKNAIVSEFGNCLNLVISQSRYLLYTAGIDEESGQLYYNKQDQSNPIYYRLAERSDIEVEIHVSRKKRSIELIINKKNAGKWLLSESDYPKNGNQLAFFIKPSNNSSVRLSNLKIAEWHGVTDSPRSLVNQDNDIILLNNNTDRFAGKLDQIKDQNLFFTNDLFSLKIPTDSVKTVNFAKKDLSQSQPLENEVVIDFYNNSLIKGAIQPETTSDLVVIKTQYADRITIPKKHIRGVRLEEVSKLLESWNTKH